MYIGSSTHRDANALRKICLLLLVMQEMGWLVLMGMMVIGMPVLLGEVDCTGTVATADSAAGKALGLARLEPL